MTTIVIGVLTMIAAVPAVGFVASYVRMPWYRSLIGRGVMLMMVDMVLLVGLAASGVIFGRDHAWFETSKLFVFAWLDVSLWVKYIALLRVRRETPHRQP